MIELGKGKVGRTRTCDKLCYQQRSLVATLTAPLRPDGGLALVISPTREVGDKNGPRS